MPPRKNAKLELGEQRTHRCYRVFSADSGYDSISESYSPMWLSIVDEMCNTGPILALTRKLRGVLCNALERIAAAMKFWMTSVVGGVSASAGGGKKVVKRKGANQTVCRSGCVDNKAGDADDAMTPHL